MNYDELLDLIDEAYHNAAPVAFADRDTALKVVGAGLKFLTNLCEDKEDEARREACTMLTQEGQALEKEDGSKAEDTN